MASLKFRAGNLKLDALKWAEDFRSGNNHLRKLPRWTFVAGNGGYSSGDLQKSICGAQRTIWQRARDAEFVRRNSPLSIHPTSSHSQPFADIEKFEPYP